MIIKRDFYNQNTIKVAKELLGCFLVREYRGKIIRARITETEAYRGFHDAASHAARGRTPRTELMFGKPGYAYVYLIYGMYSMLNVVTEGVDYPAAVLIRGIEVSVEASIEASKKNNIFLDGPGKLTKFLHIDKTLNGHDLALGEKLWIECPAKKKKFKITKSARVGVDYARHCKEWKWNFKVTNYEINTKYENTNRVIINF
jgi:DNA-3-methyladenine glycosylase